MGTRLGAHRTVPVALWHHLVAGVCSGVSREGAKVVLSLGLGWGEGAGD